MSYVADITITFTIRTMILYFKTIDSILQED